VPEFRAARCLLCYLGRCTVGLSSLNRNPAIRSSYPPGAGRPDEQIAECPIRAQMLEYGVVEGCGSRSPVRTSIALPKPLPTSSLDLRHLNREASGTRGPEFKSRPPDNDNPLENGGSSCDPERAATQGRVLSGRADVQLWGKGANTPSPGSTSVYGA
jgi:hypothetical protein